MPWAMRGGAAGIGGEIAADGAGAFRRQELRIEPVDRRRGLAGALQGDAGLAGDGVRGRIDLADAVEPVERQHDLVVQRDLAADEAGIAALRHDRRRRLVGELEDFRHFVDRRRPQHHRRMALEHVAHLDQIRRLLLRIGDGVFLADDRGEAREQRGGDGDGVCRASGASVQWVLSFQGSYTTTPVSAKWRTLLSDDDQLVNASRRGDQKIGGTAQHSFCCKHPAKRYPVNQDIGRKWQCALAK